jgi:hypothetical protein
MFADSQQMMTYFLQDDVPLPPLEVDFFQS